MEELKGDVNAETGKKADIFDLRESSKVFSFLALPLTNPIIMKDFK